MTTQENGKITSASGSIKADSITPSVNGRDHFNATTVTFSRQDSGQGYTITGYEELEDGKILGIKLLIPDDNSRETQLYFNLNGNLIQAYEHSEGGFALDTENRTFRANFRLRFREGTNAYYVENGSIDVRY
ncbi:hypothetical protein [Pseudomonas sp. Marseille-Q5115]|uniref:hypothetical protein n=1 Tax=Pseudomonas sp. Marseille-Q5115 TaxID=2866593 RepID=UPI001CE455B4|nr:hypothetical protein [Pseudomonas sp. Marseille-Q5115]